MIHGEVIGNSVDGYERVITLVPQDSNHQIVGYLLQHEEYLEVSEESKIIQIGKDYTFDISIDLVDEYSVCAETEILGFVQPASNLPSIVVMGRVVEIVSADEVKVQIPELDNNVLVEFEKNISIEVESVISFKGQLKFGFLDS